MAGPAYAPEDGFIFSWYSSSASQRQNTYVPACANPTTLNWIEATGFPTRVAPAPTYQCRDYGTSTYHQRDFTYQFLPEESLPSAGPIEDYTGQPYDKSSSAPTPPSQSTAEQSIEDELAKPQNDELRQWLNYWLGSPLQTDPTGINPPNAGIEFPRFEEHWFDHGHQFPEYTDPWEYWQGAVDIIERGDRGGEGVDRCERPDGAIVYWDTREASFVVVKDGRIITYFKPDNADAYWLEQCPT
jgi:hypothetical protein